MASSSATQETGSSNQKAPVYEIRGRTMTLEEWELVVQVESPVDFLSLARHGCDLRDIYQAQGLMDYFGMLSGPTYLTLVRHFWVRAQLYDQKAAKLEMDEKVLIDPSLEGKTREEMGLTFQRRGNQIKRPENSSSHLSRHNCWGDQKSFRRKIHFWLERQEKLLDTHCQPNLVQQLYQKKVQGYGYEDQDATEDPE